MDTSSREVHARIRSGPRFDDGSAAARRGVAVMCLVSIALIHLIDVRDKFEEVPYVGVLFVGLIVTSLVLAEALLRRDDALIWLAAGALAASTIVGYVVSRTVGLPGDGGGDIGNWWEGLGLASLMVEAGLVWLAAARLASRLASAAA